MSYDDTTGTSSSSSLLPERHSTRQSSSKLTAEEQLFGRPFAYYKDKKEGMSLRLWGAGIVAVIICACDFLLATNIVIYMRTMNPDSKEDVASHTALIILHVALIWVTYKAYAWYVEAYGIKKQVQKTEMYQRVANEVYELESMLRPARERND